MKIKFLMPAVLVLLLIFACKNDNKQEEDRMFENDVQFSPTPNEISRKDSEDIDGEANSASSVETDRTTSSTAALSAPTGQYLKVDEQENNNCGCYCIDINLNSTSELCLVEDAMYISTRMEKSGNNINIYLVEPAARNSEGRNFPWQDFDTDTPIATITPQNNGELKFDWLGFTINGDLAMDYAIYGKKTLEGVYKKK